MRIVVIVCALLVAATAKAGWQEPAETMPPGQIHQLFDAMLVMQAQDALTLSEQQYGPFVTRVKALQDVRRRYQGERQRLLAELQRMTNPRRDVAAPDAEIELRLSELQELDARSAAELRRAYGGVDEVLNLRQRARFRILEEQFERRKLELVSRARQNNQNRPVRPQPRRPPGL